MTAALYPTISEFASAVEGVGDNPSSLRVIESIPDALTKGILTLDGDELWMDSFYSYEIAQPIFTPYVFRSDGAIEIRGSVAGTTSLVSFHASKPMLEVDMLNGALAVFNSVFAQPYALPTTPCFKLYNTSFNPNAFLYYNASIINGAGKLMDLDSLPYYVIQNLFIDFHDGFTANNCSSQNYVSCDITGVKNSIGNVLFRFFGSANIVDVVNIFRTNSQSNEVGMYIDPSFTPNVFTVDKYHSDGAGPSFLAGSLTQDDEGFDFTKSRPIPDSRAKVVATSKNNFLITDSLQLSTPVKVNAVWVQSSGSSRLSVDSTGTLTSISDSPWFLNIKTYLNMLVQGGTDRPWELLFFLNGLELDDFSVKFELSSGFTDSKSPSAEIELFKNDTIELYLRDLDPLGGTGGASSHQIQCLDCNFRANS